MERMFYANGKPIGMKWYKFLIYFGLIVSPILNLVNAFNYITGNIYSSQTNGEVSAAIIYAYYGLGLKVLDVLYGVLMIGFAVLALVLRNKLANYKSDSLKYIKIFYSLLAVIPFSYSRNAVTSSSTSIS